MSQQDTLNAILAQIRDHEELQDAIWEMDFDGEEALRYDLEFLLEHGKSNYDLVPFAADGCGGVFCLLNGQRVGLIDSEGGAGIIAEDVLSFFRILLNCYFWINCFQVGAFDSPEAFQSVMARQYMRMDPVETEYDALRKRWAKKLGLEADITQVYQVFKAGVSASPALVIAPTDEDYGESDCLFGIDEEAQAYLKRLMAEHPENH